MLCCSWRLWPLQLAERPGWPAWGCAPRPCLHVQEDPGERLGQDVICELSCVMRTCSALNQLGYWVLVCPELKQLRLELLAAVKDCY